MRDSEKADDLAETSDYQPTSDEDAPNSSSDDDDGSDYAPSEDDRPRKQPAKRKPIGRPAGASSGPGTAPRSVGGASGGRTAAPKRPRVGAGPKLTDILHTASKEQLVSLVLDLNDEAGGSLEDRITALLPPPDLSVRCAAWWVPAVAGCRRLPLRSCPRKSIQPRPPFMLVAIAHRASARSCRPWSSE